MRSLVLTLAIIVHWVGVLFSVICAVMMSSPWIWLIALWLAAAAAILLQRYILPVTREHDRLDKERKRWGGGYRVH